MTVLTRRLMGGGGSEMNISDLVYTCQRYHFDKLVFDKWNG